MSALEGWDLMRYRVFLRRRAASLQIDPRVQVRFDESDLVQETLLRAADPERPRCVGASEQERLEWLFAIQANILLDKYDEHFAQKRDAKREASFDALKKALGDSTHDFIVELNGKSPGPFDAAVRREEVDILEELLAQLPDELREVLLLRRSGHTLAEIAAALGVTIGVVAGRLTKGTRLLTRLSRDYRTRDHLA